MNFCKVHNGFRTNGSVQMTVQVYFRKAMNGIPYFLVNSHAFSFLTEHFLDIRSGLFFSVQGETLSL